MSEETMLDKANSLSAELIRLRRKIHQYPELSFQEFMTAELVADTLTEIGIAVKRNVGRTGVVGEIGDGNGPTIVIRADMDALPILEKNDVAYRSTNDGVMHACGHDAHTAILLGAAHLLRQSFIEENWSGRVRFLFQPSEEAFDEDGVSGAPAMIDDGALVGVDAAIALHVNANLKSGVCFFQDGPAMAAVDTFDARLIGAGGHGAHPDLTNDPLFMLAPVLTALYAIPSRRIDPLRSSVVSIGQIHAGSAPNIIPGEVFLQGTLRSFVPEVREQLWDEVKRALSITESLGGSYEVTFARGYPPLVNDEKVNGWLRDVVRDLSGEEAIQNTEFGMGAEDFAYMAREAPGAMFYLGAALDDGVPRGHHTDTFDIDEAVLPLGAAILAETARRYVTGMLD